MISRDHLIIRFIFICLTNLTRAAITSAPVHVIVRPVENRRTGGRRHVSTNRVIRHEIFSATTLSSRSEASGCFQSFFPCVCSGESAGRGALLYQYTGPDFELCSALLRPRERILLGRRRRNETVPSGACSFIASVQAYSRLAKSVPQRASPALSMRLSKLSSSDRLMLYRREAGGCSHLFHK